MKKIKAVIHARPSSTKFGYPPDSKKQPHYLLNAKTYGIARATGVFRVQQF